MRTSMYWYDPMDLHDVPYVLFLLLRFLFNERCIGPLLKY